MILTSWQHIVLKTYKLYSIFSSGAKYTMYTMFMPQGASKYLWWRSTNEILYGAGTRLATFFMCCNGCWFLSRHWSQQFTELQLKKWKNTQFFLNLMILKTRFLKLGFLEGHILFSESQLSHREGIKRQLFQYSCNWQIGLPCSLIWQSNTTVASILGDKSYLGHLTTVSKQSVMIRWMKNLERKNMSLLIKGMWFLFSIKVSIFHFSIFSVAESLIISSMIKHTWQKEGNDKALSTLPEIQVDVAESLDSLVCNVIER